MGLRYGSSAVGLAGTIRRAFNKHPLGTPLATIATAVIAFAFILPQLTLARGHGGTAASAAHAPLTLVLIFFGIAGVCGIVMLPFGVTKVVRKHQNPIVLTCPKCHIESRAMETPFHVERLGALDYAYVTCSQCGNDFPVPAGREIGLNRSCGSLGVYLRPSVAAMRKWIPSTGQSAISGKWFDPTSLSDDAEDALQPSWIRVAVRPRDSHSQYH